MFGELGYGKSALMKTLLWRMLLFGRRAFVLDVKGEYASHLCDAVGVQPVRLAPGNGVRLNPLTARRERGPAVESSRRGSRRRRAARFDPRRPEGLREALADVCHRQDSEPTIPRRAGAAVYPEHDRMAECVAQLQGDAC